MDEEIYWCKCKSVAEDNAHKSTQVAKPKVLFFYIEPAFCFSATSAAVDRMAKYYRDKCLIICGHGCPRDCNCMRAQTKQMFYRLSRQFCSKTKHNESGGFC